MDRFPEAPATAGSGKGSMAQIHPRILDRLRRNRDRNLAILPEVKRQALRDLDQLRAAVRAIMAESDAGGLAGIDQELEELTAAIIRVSPTDPRVGDDLRAISRRLAAAKERIERQFRP